MLKKRSVKEADLEIKEEEDDDDNLSIHSFESTISNMENLLTKRKMTMAAEKSFK